MAKPLTDPGLLRKVPIFNSLSDAELMQILKSPDNCIEDYAAKQLIIREAEAGDCMYVLLEGKVEVSIRGGASERDMTIATLHPGDFFGEQALIVEDETGRRNASVRALFPSKVFKIVKKHVHLAVHRGRGVRRAAMAEDKTDAKQLASPRARKIRALVSSMRLFKSLNQEELDSIGSWTEVIDIGPGDFVLKESEKADCLYVVLEGTVEIFTHDDAGKIIILATLSRGNYFGEQALLPGSSGKRNAYARSNNDAKLIKIPKAYFQLILNRDSVLAKALKQIGETQSRTLTKLHKGD